MKKFTVFLFFLTTLFVFSSQIALASSLGDVLMNNTSPRTPAEIYACNDKPVGQGSGCSTGKIYDIALHAGADELLIEVTGVHKRSSGGSKKAKWYNPNTWNQIEIVVVYTTYPSCVIHFKMSQYEEGLALLNVLKTGDYKKLTCRSNVVESNGEFKISRVQWNTQGSITLEY